MAYFHFTIFLAFKIILVRLIWPWKMESDHIYRINNWAYNTHFWNGYKSVNAKKRLDTAGNSAYFSWVYCHILSGTVHITVVETINKKHAPIQNETARALSLSLALIWLITLVCSFFKVEVDDLQNNRRYIFYCDCEIGVAGRWYNVQGKSEKLLHCSISQKEFSEILKKHI